MSNQNSNTRKSATGLFRLAAGKYQDMERARVDLTKLYRKIAGIPYFKQKADDMQQMIELCTEHNAWVEKVLSKCSKAYKPYLIRLYILKDKETDIAKECGITDRRLRVLLRQTLEAVITPEMADEYDSIIQRIETLNKQRGAKQWTI